MALLKPFETEHGIIGSEGYYRITEFFMSVDEERVGLQLATYINKEARDNGMKPIKVTPYQIFRDGMEKSNGQWQAKLHVEGSLEIYFNETSTSFEMGEALLADLESNPLNDLFVFSLENGLLTVTARNGTASEGAAGASFDLGGTAIESSWMVVAPHDEKPSTLQTYFAVSVLDQYNVNVIQQCYEYLKTLPEFSGAVDV